ncbi:MAG: 30S ribosome-binding factor RbfA [Parachlamydiales bacterium]
MNRRLLRLNSLLREVISDVIRKEVRDPSVHPLFTITRVEVTKDLEMAKVFVSVIGEDAERKMTVDALNRGAGFIAVASSKQVVIRTFPKLVFYVDDTAEKQAHIIKIANALQEERQARGGDDENG